MDSQLTRADKRKMKKKERKRKQRQLLAISAKSSSVLPVNEEDDEESSSNEEGEEVSVTIPSICEECKENKVQYHCLDCKRYYCQSVRSS